MRIKLKLPDMLEVVTPFRTLDRLVFLSAVEGGAVAVTGTCKGGCPAVLGSSITPAECVI